MSDDRTARLSRAWDQAGDHYQRYFEPRFAPWVSTAVGGLPAVFPAGPVLVPCCGTFPELPVIAAEHPEREIVGIDLSAGMVERGRRRAAPYPLAHLVCQDASDLTSSWPGDAGAVVSVFGLQQLPDPVDAITNWVRTLRSGGWLSVVYWPPVTEAVGPFALLQAAVDEELSGDPEPNWPEHLAHEIECAGARVAHDIDVFHPMSHPDATTFWSAMTEGGPLRPLVDAHDEEFVNSLRARFLGRAPLGPWHHRPVARWILAVRQ